MAGTECIFKTYSPGSNLVYLVTVDSDQDAYEAEVRRLCKKLEDEGVEDFVVKAVPDLIYSDFIKVFRSTQHGIGGMEHHHMIAILKSGQYVLA
uniref:Uncharacterized protein n=1 Tax=Pseudomonas phage HRDY3 TaxID=3236930 RepID=A0AB39CE84_9VIRU